MLGVETKHKKRLDFKQGIFCELSLIIYLMVKSRLYLYIS